MVVLLLGRWSCISVCHDYFPLFSVLMLTELDVLPMPARKTTCPSSRAAARLARTWLRGSVTSLKKKRGGGGGGGEEGVKLKHTNAMFKVVVPVATGISQIS